MRLVSGKKGEVVINYIFILFAIIIIISIVICVIYKFYIYDIVHIVSKDLFYIGQNAGFMALDNKELSYGNYIINNNKLRSIAEILINKNYPSQVRLQNIVYIEEKNLLQIVVIIKLELSIPLKNKIVLNIPVSQIMKLRLMEVE